MSKKKPKIVFLGSDLSPISLGCLQELAKGNRYELLVGIDHHDKSAWQFLNMTWQRHGWRGVISRIMRLIVAQAKTVQRPVTNVQDGRSLREVARLQQMENFTCARINGPDAVQIITSFAPQLIIVANFSQIIRSEILAIPKLGVINFHPSLLPKYRGPLPCYWIIKNRETKSGATVHFIDGGIDTGDILMQQELPVLPNDTEKTLINRSVEVGAPLLAHAVESLIRGTAHRTAQAESESSYYGFPKRGTVAVSVPDTEKPRL